MSSELKEKTIKGIVWSAVEKFGVKIISFLSNIFLARMLTPDDYGCIGMLAIFIVISNAFVYGGFSSALIQKKEPTATDYSTVFYWNLIVSVFFYIFLYCTAPKISVFYNLPLLRDVLRVQGIILFINAFNIIQITQLKKQLNFKKLAQINIYASLLSVFVAVSLAYLGYGVWSLVLQQLCAGVFSSIFLWFKSQWKPNWNFSKKSFRELFSYGSYLLLSDLLNSTVDNIQGLIIGRLFPAATMGYYSQAKRLEEIPTTSISQMVQQVTFPVFAKIQDDKKKLFFAVKKSLLAMNFINIPLMTLLWVIAEPLIVTLFSDKWLHSVSYFQILCVAGLVNCMQSVNYQVVSAVGRSKDIFKWNIVKRTVGIIFIIVGAYFGVEGILWGMVSGFWFTYIVNAVVATKTTDYTLFMQIMDTLPIAFVAVISAFPAYFFHDIQINTMLLLIIQTTLYGVTYILLSKLFGIKQLEECITLVGVFIQRFREK